MAYRVLIPEWIAAKVRAVQPSVVAEFAEGLRKLGERPRLGGKIQGGEFEGLMAYRFRVWKHPLTREFAVLYQFDPNEQDLHILDVGVLRGDPPHLDPPSFRVEPE